MATGKKADETPTVDTNATPDETPQPTTRNGQILKITGPAFTDYFEYHDGDGDEDDKVYVISTTGTEVPSASVAKAVIAAAEGIGITIERVDH